jgi:hypothetical protein
MIVIGVAGPVFNTLMQLHLDERHVDLLWFGLLVAAQNGLGALLGLLLRGPISVKLGRWRPDMLVLLPAIAAFGLLNTASLLTIPMVLAGIEAAKGIAFVIVSGELSSSYESDARATVLSMQSVLIRIASIGVNSALAASSQSRASGQLCYTLAVALGGIAVIYKLFVSKYDGQSFSTNVAKCVNPEG